jgi:hypothetical protein
VGLVSAPAETGGEYHEPTPLVDPAQIAELDRLLPGFAEETKGVVGQLNQVGIAEQALGEASELYPAEADQLFHSLHLLMATHPHMTTPFVYRAHCRELAERIAKSEDTQDATAMEVIYGLMQVTKAAPINTVGAGLYFRLWTRAGLGHLVDTTESSRHYEALRGTQIDDAEAICRRKLAQVWRQLGPIICDGFHYGEPVVCRYTK